MPLRVGREPAPLDVATHSAPAASSHAATHSAPADSAPAASAPAARSRAAARSHTVASGSPGRHSGHPAAAFRFSCALMCSFFSASACGLNRDEARSMKSMAKEAPASNLFFSHGRSTRSR